MAINEEFRLVIDFCRENYEPMLMNSNLKDLVPNNLSIYQGFLFLNGAVRQDKGTTDLDDI